MPLFPTNKAISQTHTHKIMVGNTKKKDTTQSLQILLLLLLPSYNQHQCKIDRLENSNVFIMKFKWIRKKKLLKR